MLYIQEKIYFALMSKRLTLLHTWHLNKLSYIDGLLFGMKERCYSILYRFISSKTLNDLLHQCYENGDINYDYLKYIVKPI